MRSDLKPLAISQPEGPSFTVDGALVRWQKWQFRVGFTPREGLVLHTVGWEDNGRLRPVLHRAAMSDMVVPYGDPAPTHHRKNTFDGGELNFGALVNSLTLGCDCLGEIHYFDAALVDQDGKAYAVKNAICMHEEDYGVLWRHMNMRTNQTEVRRSRRLVVSSFSTIGNYDYGIFWYLYQDGTIQCEVKLTGILSTGAVPVGQTPRYGQLLNEDGLYAPIHQHFFNFRLDLDVDGPVNTVYEEHAEADPAGPGNVLGAAFRTVRTPLRTELEAQQLIDPLRGRVWRVVNPQRRNAVGEPVGYRLVPHGNVQAIGQRRVQRGQASRLHDQASLGHAVRRPRALRRRRFPLPASGRRRTARVDSRRPPDRRDRRRALVHRGESPCAASRRLAGDAGLLRGLSLAAGGVLRRQPGPRRAAAYAARERALLLVEEGIGASPTGGFG